MSEGQCKYSVQCFPPEMISSNKRIVGMISVGFLRVKSNVESISGLLFLEMYMILLLFSWIFIAMLSVILCLLYVKVLLYEELSSVRRSAMGVWCFIGKQHLPLWEFLHKFSLQALSFFFFFFGRSLFNCFSSPTR